MFPVRWRKKKKILVCLITTSHYFSCQLFCLILYQGKKDFIAIFMILRQPEVVNWWVSGVCRSQSASDNCKRFQAPFDIVWQRVTPLQAIDLFTKGVHKVLQVHCIQFKSLADNQIIKMHQILGRLIFTRYSGFQKIPHIFNQKKWLYAGFVIPGWIKYRLQRAPMFQSSTWDSDTTSPYVLQGLYCDLRDIRVFHVNT